MLRKFLLIILPTLIVYNSPSFTWADTYRLGPEDVLKITVYREDELTRDVRVTSNGFITYPFLGELEVDGLTVSELEEKVTSGLEKYLLKPQVTVFIKKYSTITVMGQVEEPGAFSLKERLTVIEAIGLAGGFTKIASRNKVQVMRRVNGKNKTIVVPVASITKKGNREKDVILKRGDVVYVPESLF